MAKRYQIDLILNVSQSEAAARRASGGMGTIETAADRAGRAAERAAQKAFDAQSRAVDAIVRAGQRAAVGQERLEQRKAEATARSAQRRQDAEERAYQSIMRAGARAEAQHKAQEQRKADATASAAQKAFDAQNKSVDSIARAGDRATSAQERLEQRKADAAARAAQKQQDAQQRAFDSIMRAGARAESQHQTQEQRKADAAARIAQRGAEQQVKVQRQLDAELANLETAGIARAQERAQRLQDTIIGLGTGAAAAALALGVQQFNAISEAAWEASKRTLQYHEALLELAALGGDRGNTGKELAADVAFRAQTLQSQPQSIAFKTGALNVAQSMILSDAEAKDPKRPGITNAEFQKALVRAGQFQALSGEDPRAQGELVGMLPLLLGGRVTGEQASRKYGQIDRIAREGGSSFASFAKQYSGIAGYITSGFYDPMKAAGLLSAFSVTEKDRAGERLEQFTRATVGGIGRMRGAGVEDSVKQGQYLKGIGAKATMGSMGIGDLIVADLEREEAARKAKGEGFSSYDYLTHHGYRNQQDIIALQQYQGMKRSGMLAKRFIPLTEGAGPTAASMDATIASKAATNPVLADRKAKLAGELADAVVGNPAEMHYRQMEEVAFNALRARKNKDGSTGTFGVTGDYKDFANGAWTLAHPAQIVGLSSVRTEMEDAENRRRRKVGLQDIHPFDTIGVSRPDNLRNAFMESQQQVAARGGDTTADLAPNVEAVKQLTASVDKLNATILARQNPAAQPKAAPPALVKPNQPAANVGWWGGLLDAAGIF